MKTVAIIPAYNEALHIAKVIEGTKQYVDEVIVVDDGSVDTTFENSSNASLVLKHVVNMGKGLAMSTGFEAALAWKADIVIFIDADSQHDSKDIPRLLEKMNSGGYDLVTGVRRFDKNMPFILRFGNWFLQNSFNILYNSDIKDFSNGLRAIKTSIYPLIKWNSEGYTVETEVLAKARKHKLKVGQIPIKTIYLNTVKGTTIFDGIKIFLKMVYWRIYG